jgi:hypothetical protein
MQVVKRQPFLKFSIVVDRFNSLEQFWTRGASNLSRTGEDGAHEDDD